MGSKNGIAEWVISKMPKADNLYDLFCGGGAVTHAAMLTNKFRHVYMNDLNPFAELFVDAVRGKFHNENRWISRADFERLKSTEPYVAYCWSFGNNMKGYLYSPENEQVKKALWFAVMYDDWTLADTLGIPFKRTKCTDTKHRRLDIMRHWKKYVVPKIKSGKLNFDKRMELQRLERLQLNYTCGSYKDVAIKPDSVVYCDIPYRGTAKYTANEGGFNYTEFYDWAHAQTELTLISEYSMPKGFVCVGRQTKRNILSATANTKALERIFVPDNQAELYRDKMAQKLTNVAQPTD